MWDVTVWAVATWLKLTLLLTLAVAGCWLLFGAGSGPFLLAVTAATIAEIYLCRQLVREWTHEAGLHWWWST